MVWGRVTDWTDSFCEIGLPLYGLLLRARALGSPQIDLYDLHGEQTCYKIVQIQSPGLATSGRLRLLSSLWVLLWLRRLAETLECERAKST